MLHSVAPGFPWTIQSGGLGRAPPPRMLQSGASFCRILSVASDAPVRGTGFTPRRSSPGASVVLHSAPDAPIRGVFLWYSLRCLRCSSPWHRVLPQTIQSGGFGPYSTPPRCSNPGLLFVVFSPLPRTLQSVAPGSPPDDPVRGLGLSSIPPPMLQSGASCISLSLLSSAFACVVHLCLFFRAPIVVAPPPRAPLHFAFPPALSSPSPPPSPSVPFLSSPAPSPSLCGGFAGARTHAPSFYACMLLCFWAGTNVHSSSFFLAFSLFSCFVPLHAPSLVACTLCVAFAYFVASPLLFVWGVSY